MRDISAIKSRLTGTQPTLSPTLPKDITTLRQEELKKDSSNIETTTLITVRTKFKKQIQEQQQELDKLASQITHNRQAASDEIEKVLKDAQSKASKLISQAQAIRGEADALLSTQLKQKQQLEDLEKELSIREKTVDIKEDNVNKERIKVAIDAENVNKTILVADKRYQEALECHNSAVSLLTLSVDQMENLAQIRQEVSEVIYQNVSKISIMYKRVVTLMKILDGDKRSLEEKAIELQKKERLLVDRRGQLDRVAAELKQNGKRNL